MLIPYFAIVYAKCGANHFDYIFNGGERFNICGLDDFFKCGIHVLLIRYVPLVLIECIKSYFFISVVSVSVSEIALALFTNISIPPNVSTVFLTASYISFSKRISHYMPNALPPAFSISAQADAIVPGNLGCGSTVLANITTLAPSLAALIPIANPIPYILLMIITLEPPLIMTVLPFKLPTYSKGKVSGYFMTHG